MELHLRKLKGSLPRSQEPTTCPYPRPDESNPCSPIIFVYGLITNVQSFQNK